MAEILGANEGNGDVVDYFVDHRDRSQIAARGRI